MHFFDTDGGATPTYIWGIEIKKEDEQMANRGRPRGPSKQDSKMLDEIADRLTKQSNLSVNSIIVSLCPDGVDMENHRRKLHRWWNRQSEERLAAANERREESRPRRVVNANGNNPTYLITHRMALEALENAGLNTHANSINAAINQVRGIKEIMAQFTAQEQTIRELQRFSDPLKDIRKTLAMSGLLR
jgi:hypothetical protein